MAQEKPFKFKYDVFISYAYRDKKWVKDSLVPKLQEINLKLCFDERNLKVGKSVISQVEKAIQESKYLIIVLTPDYVQSKWSSFENLLVKSIDPVNRQKRVIPILLHECQLPLRIKNLAFLDFTEEGNEQSSQFERFFKLLSGSKRQERSNEQKKYREYNLIKLNNFCNKSFSDRELIDLSYDHFSKVYENISVGMSKEAKVRLILEYCERYQLVDEFIDLIKKHKPDLSTQIDEVIQG